MLVIWTENAKNNLRDYMCNSHLVYQNKLENYVNSLINYVNDLQTFEKLGKFLFNKGDFEVRQLIYNVHRVFYAIHKDTVYILLISHTARDMNTIMKYLNNKNFTDLLL